MSKSDPMTVVEEHRPVPNNPAMLEWVQIGRTETVKDELNPEWNRKIRMDYWFEVKQDMRFRLWANLSAFIFILFGPWCKLNYNLGLGQFQFRLPKIFKINLCLHCYKYVESSRNQWIILRFSGSKGVFIWILSWSTGHLESKIYELFFVNSIG